MNFIIRIWKLWKFLKYFQYLFKIFQKMHKKQCNNLYPLPHITLQDNAAAGRKFSVMFMLYEDRWQQLITRRAFPSMQFEYNRARAFSITERAPPAWSSIVQLDPTLIWRGPFEDFFRSLMWATGYHVRNWGQLDVSIRFGMRGGNTGNEEGLRGWQKRGNGEGARRNWVWRKKLRGVRFGTFGSVGWIVF